MYKHINFQKIYEDLAVQQTIDSMAASQETVKLDMTLPQSELANIKNHSSASPYVGYAVDPLESNAKKASKTIKVYYDSTPDVVSAVATQASDSYYLPLSDSDIQTLQSGQSLLDLALRAPDDPTKAAVVNSVTGNGTMQVVLNLTSQAQPMQAQAEAQPQMDAQYTEETSEAPTQAELTPDMPMGEGLITSFEAFLNEGKKKEWIKDVKMKKGALKKQLGDDELTFADLEKASKDLKKKDKDPKKKGLQLNKKDATLQKRLTLAKNLMKAANESLLTESKHSQIAAIKNQLVEIHKVIEDAIKKTARK